MDRAASLPGEGDTVQSYRSALPADEVLSHACSLYGLDIDAKVLGPAAVGGDLWGLLPLDQRRFALYVADFCGHGVSAAPYAIYLSKLMGGGQCPIDEPQAALRWLNARMFKDLARGSFLTMNYAIIDLARDSVQISTSACQGVIIRNPDLGNCQISDVIGLPLGFIEDAVFEAREYEFWPGACLTVYSDALIETPLPPDNRLSPGEVASIIASGSVGATARAINDSILRPLNLEEEGLLDDLTLVTLCRK